MHHYTLYVCVLALLQGFYCVLRDQPADMLVEGPYQGSLGCLTPRK
jgi:putative methionine-R-sulfoxide reductase with GAF domain